MVQTQQVQAVEPGMMTGSQWQKLGGGSASILDKKEEKEPRICDRAPGGTGKCFKTETCTECGRF